jgi:hypothetical protein
VAAIAGTTASKNAPTNTITNTIRIATRLFDISDTPVIVSKMCLL